MGNSVEVWIGHAANIGVIAGLILVAYQVAQTNDALDRESREWATTTQMGMNEMYNNYREYMLDHMDIWERGGRGEDLDSTENAIYEELAFGYFWLEAQMARIVETRNRETWGVASQAFARQILDRIYGKPGHEAQFKRWSELPGSIRAAEFVKVVLDVRESEYEPKTSP